jgi:hypothetical protein
MFLLASRSTHWPASPGELLTPRPRSRPDGIHSRNLPGKPHIVLPGYRLPFSCTAALGMGMGAGTPGFPRQTRTTGPRRLRRTVDGTLSQRRLWGGQVGGLRSSGPARSGPAQGSRVLRPADLLALPRRAFVRVARRPRLPRGRPPVATRLYRQLPRQDSHLQERVTFHGAPQRLAAQHRVLRASSAQAFRSALISRAQGFRHFVRLRRGSN